ncbi:MAG TPA: multicopper oxidase family protein [Thermodesulfobacteriota bacterium]|nr:multicopper oxidase family protein [Thermodesulfobacteriota bacterium]
MRFLVKAAAAISLILIVPVFSVGGCDNNNHKPLGEPFRNPPIISSVDGVIDEDFDVIYSLNEVNGKQFTSPTYNGLYTPPVLKVNPGDTIRLRLRNSIDQMTNEHFHGMNVSPLSPSDDIFIMVPPTGDFEYVVNIPDDHPVGMFYYHAHLFGLTEYQIMSGLSGGLIVNGILDPFPQLDGITQQVMYLKDVQIIDGTVPQGDDIDISAPTNPTVNGQTNPVLSIRPGETQFWEIANIGADHYYDLELEGHQFYEIERDGNRHNQTVVKDEEFMPTASRVGVLVQGGKPGVYRLRAKKISTGPQGDQYGGETVLTMVVEGDPVENPIQLPIAEQEFPVVENLCDQPVQRERNFVFSETENGDTFFINGKEFDPERVDTVVQIGTLERWTIQNVSQELHVFHIHQIDFQVCEINGIEQPFVGYQDTVNLPYDGQDPAWDGPGEVVVVLDFRNPIIEGKAVYHCHIGQHEDNGMMAVFQACFADECPPEEM